MSCVCHILIYQHIWLLKRAFHADYFKKWRRCLWLQCSSFHLLSKVKMESVFVIHMRIYSWLLGLSRNQNSKWKSNAPFLLKHDWRCQKCFYPHTWSKAFTVWLKWITKTRDESEFNQDLKMNSPFHCDLMSVTQNCSWGASLIDIAWNDALWLHLTLTAPESEMPFVL